MRRAGSWRCLWGCAALLALVWGCGDGEGEVATEGSAADPSHVESSPAVQTSGPAMQSSTPEGQSSTPEGQTSASGATGEQGGPCHPDGTCDAGLACEADRCLEEGTSEPATQESFDPAEYALIPAGTYMKGSPPGEFGRANGNFEDQVSVTLTRDFYLQTKPVTRGQYQLLMGYDPHPQANCGMNCPAVVVTWFDAISYANALSRSEGFTECYDDEGSVVGGATVYDCEGYRLPTEYEWEYAVRAGTTTATYNGDVPRGETLRDCAATQPVLDEIAWYECNFDQDAPSPEVGMKAPNEWGLYDMLGRVEEWTDSWYSIWPEEGTDPTGPATGEWRMVRGTGAHSEAHAVRAAQRVGIGLESAHGGRGFRVARTN